MQCPMGYNLEAAVPFMHGMFCAGVHIIDNKRKVRAYISHGAHVLKHACVCMPNQTQCLKVQVVVAKIYYVLLLTVMQTLQLT